MIETVLPLLAICFFARMSPGPDMMLLIRHATSGVAATDNTPRHFNAAYACVLGVCLGLTFHVSLSVLGLALVIKSNPIIFITLRYLGAAYLVYVGWHCFSGDSSVDISGVEHAGMTTTAEGFREGLFCNLLNPKVTMFILSVFMQFVGPDATLSEKVICGAVIIVEGLIGWTFFVMFLNTDFMQRLYRVHAGKINKVTGAVLLMLGLAVVFSG